MKVECIEEIKRVQFPCLFINTNGAIILAIGTNGDYYKGTLLKDEKGDNSLIGEYSERFIKGHFTEYKDKIILSNN